MKRVVLTVCIPIIFLLSSCMSSNVQVYNQIDSSDKTITVPAGNSLLIGALKTKLKEMGWKLVIDRGPIRTVGTIGKNTNIATGNTFNTRYRLVIQQFQFDYCLTGSAAINYDLSIIDNNSGEEVISQSGKDCQDRAVAKFISALNNKQ